MMNTNLKVIIAAMGIAVLASPVMAQPESNAHRAAISNAHGSVTRAQASRAVPVSRSDRVEDCIHVQFPQCGGAHQL
jgi:hypothetical protein